MKWYSCSNNNIYTLNLPNYRATRAGKIDPYNELITTRSSIITSTTFAGYSIIIQTSVPSQLHSFTLNDFPKAVHNYIPQTGWSQTGDKEDLSIGFPSSNPR